jgi:hypothetical protein
LIQRIGKGPKEIQTMYGSIERALNCWSFAIGTLFHIWSRDWLTICALESLPAMRHPLPHFRWMLALNTATVGLPVWVKPAPTNAKAAMLSGLPMAAHAYARVSGLPVDTLMLKDAIDRLDPVIWQFEEDWARLYPKLQSHARVPLIVPKSPRSKEMR